MSSGLIIATLATVFVAALLKATLGFGEGLIAMPLLTLALGIRTASPLMGLVGTSLTALILCTSWQSVDLRAARQLVLGAVLGVPLGVWGLKTLPAAWVTAGLGAVLILTGLHSLTRPEFGGLVSPRWGYVAGLGAGILGGAYNTSGPPLVLYGSLRRWPPDKFRATLQGCFLPIVAIRLVGHAVAGLWTPRVLLLYGLSVPLVLAAFWLGTRASRLVSAGGFERFVHGGLIALGATLIVDSLW